EEAFDRGRQVLVRKCITCHDMRTILAKPRTAKGWMSINERMLEKPAVFGEALDPDEIPFVTAYLVAITPDIQRSAKSRRDEDRALAARADALVDAMHDAEVGGAAVDEKLGAELVEKKCVDCHGMEDVEAHGGDDASGWRSVVAAMVDEGAEISEDEINVLAAYLALKYPPKAKPAADEKEPEPEPEPAAESESEGEAEAAEGEAEAAEGEGDEAEAAEAAPKPKPKAKPKAKGDRKAGKAIYMAKCKACHGDDGKGDTIFGSKIGIVSINRTRKSHAQVKSITANGVAGTKMKGYEGKLSDTELDDVAAFVKSLR
ncbi:MAG: c-type cytochrome, partial [Myxococcales bacterium]|nr:c-type cytochrome [Myxococcales bacterium]